MEAIAFIKPVVKKIGQGSFTGTIDSYFNAELEIGNYTSIAPPLYIHGETNHPCVFDKNLVSTYPFGNKWEVNYPKTQSKGPIIIGNDVWIGESVTLLSGVKIGDGAIVGARSVIAKDVPPYAVVVGNPARIVRYRFSSDQIQKLLKIKWWDLSKSSIVELLPLMKDINKFIKYYEENPDKFIKKYET